MTWDNPILRNIHNMPVNMPTDMDVLRRDNDRLSEENNRQRCEITALKMTIGRITADRDHYKLRLEELQTITNGSGE